MVHQPGGEHPGSASDLQHAASCHLAEEWDRGRAIVIGVVGAVGVVGQRRGHSSRRRQPATGPGAITVASTWSPCASAAPIKFRTSWTDGTPTTERLRPGGVARSAGLEATSPHFTALAKRCARGSGHGAPKHPTAAEAGGPGSPLSPSSGHLLCRVSVNFFKRTLPMNGTTLTSTNRRYSFTVHAVCSISITFSQRQQVGYAARVALGNLSALGRGESFCAARSEPVKGVFLWHTPPAPSRLTNPCRRHSFGAVLTSVPLLLPIVAGPSYLPLVSP